MSDATTILEARRLSTNVARRLSERIKERVATKLADSRLEPRSDGGIDAVERSDVTLGPLIGHGDSAEIHLADYKKDEATSSSTSPSTSTSFSSKSLLALKNVKLRTFLQMQDEHETFVRAATALAVEAHLLSCFDHPNIIRLHGWAANGVMSYAEGRHDGFFLLLERVDETLQDKLDAWQQQQQQQQDGNSAEGQTDLQKAERLLEQLNICAQLADALNYLHKHGVIYRDLHPSNIGLKDGQVKLFDFGSSREIPKMTLDEAFDMTGRVGHRNYMAPEVAQRQPYQLSADIYGFSMICYHILSLQAPYETLDKELFIQLVCEKGARPDLTTNTESWPRGMRTFLKSCWFAEPDRRLSSASVLHKMEKFTKRQVTAVKELCQQGNVVFDLGKDFAIAPKLERFETDGTGSSTGSIDSLDEVYFL